MVRTYHRKTDHGKYGSDRLVAAVRDMKAGMAAFRAASIYNIPRRTLTRHSKEQVQEPGVSRLGHYQPCLPIDVETEVHDHIQQMEKSMYGLTTTDARRLAFDLAEKAGFTHSFNKDKKLAGRDWLRGFMGRFPDLSLRNPEATSLSRAIGFNRMKVDQFYQIYHDILEQHPSLNKGSSIWNVDETGITNVQSPSRILATKGAKQVAKVTSAERGVTVTAVCAMNADGLFVPPMLIWPRIRMVDTLMTGAPPGSIGAGNQKGWMDGELFPKWLSHFAAFTKATLENPQLVILDGHHSHKTLEAITYARQNGIHLITLPPHCTHKMQPLDRSYFKSLKSAYNAACDRYMKRNPGKRITLYNMAALFTEAYLPSATPLKAVQGFRTCGLWPYNRDVFSEEDFAAARVTDESCPVEMSSVCADPAESTTAGTEMPCEDGANDDTGATPDRNISPSHAADAEECPGRSDVTQVSDNQYGPTTVVKTEADGRCLFRSLVIGNHKQLQQTERDDSGRVVDKVLCLQEKTKSDALRTETVQFMIDHVSDYDDLDQTTINADLPSHLRYNCVEDRILSMCEASTMPGELELIAVSKVLQRPIFIMDEHNMVISQYGVTYLEESTSPLLVLYTKVADDVGHYESLVVSPVDPQDNDHTSEEVEAVDTAPPPVASKSVRDLIQVLSPLPKLKELRSRKRKAESSALLTSSPYQQALLDKIRVAEQKSEKKSKKSQTSNGKNTKPRSTKGKKKQVAQKRSKKQHESSQESEAEEWPCLVCCEPFTRSRSGEVWVQCQSCSKWAHEACTMGKISYVCHNCDSDPPTSDEEI